MDETQTAVVADPIVTEQEKRAALDALLAATATLNNRKLILTSNMADNGEFFAVLGAEVRSFVDEQTGLLREEIKAHGGVRYLGVHSETTDYRPGDFVTHAGAMWHCQAITKSRPGDGNAAWKLSVKRGQKGDSGPQGDIGPMPRHEWKGTELRFEQDPGVWGKYTDLRGPAGEAGIGGGGFGAGVLPASLFTEPFSYMPSGW